MEEIKFRVYDKKEKCFHYFTLTNILQYKNEFEKHIINGDKFDLFVGLKDKNGKEIYERDKIKVLEVYNNKEKEYITDIIFEESAFLCKSGSSYYDTFINSWHNPDKRYPLIEFEIIGNPYENPELIKEVK